jgi:hypothetical protein
MFISTYFYVLIMEMRCPMCNGEVKRIMRIVHTTEAYRWPGNGDITDLKYNLEIVEYVAFPCSCTITNDEKVARILLEKGEISDADLS